MTRFLTDRQRIGVDRLLAQGFVVDGQNNSVVRLRRGNDYRLVQLDGAQKRAYGAKR